MACVVLVLLLGAYGFFVYLISLCADIRLQQRNGRKTLTTVQGLNAYIDRTKIEKLVKIFKKVTKSMLQRNKVFLKKNRTSAAMAPSSTTRSGVR